MTALPALVAFVVFLFIYYFAAKFSTGHMNLRLHMGEVQCKIRDSEECKNWVNLLY